MQFFSDNAASVHPRVWAAMQAADAPDTAYDGDALSARLDAAFTELFGAPCTALWVATGTAANCLALSAMVPPHGGVVCHKEAHIEMDEGGAPGFFLHGAKLLLAQGEGAKLGPDGLRAVLDGIRPGVHQVQPHAISITQATECGRVYAPAEVAAIGALARERGLGLHMDGARFANAVAHLGCHPADVTVRAGVSALSFGCVKNGGMSAEAVVFFAPDLADVVRYRRKRAGHLQSKGRYLAAQILAMIEGGLWLENARAANAAAQEIAAACAGRLLQPVEANEVFVSLSPAEQAALREQGFDFYDWPVSDDAPAGTLGAARLVTAWNSPPHEVAALARALSAL
jgi:threonine aldolase